jgi:hypothetical protein
MLETFGNSNLNPTEQESEHLEISPDILNVYRSKHETDALERRVEKNAIEEPIRKKNLQERIYNNLLRRGQKIAKAALLVGALSLGSVSKTEGADVSPDKPNTQTAHVELEKKQTVTAEQRAEIKKQIGYDIVEIAENSGFDVELEVPAANGKYALHIGQVHYIKDTEKDIDGSKEVIGVQKQIENILVSLVDHGNNKIFAERITEEQKDSLDSMNKMYGKIREAASSIMQGERCFDELAQACADMTSNQDENNIETGFVLAHIKNIYKNRAVELYKKLESDGQLTEDTKSSYGKALTHFASTGSLAPFGSDAVYLDGADSKLESEGRVTLLPAETDAGKANASKYDAALDKAREEYFKADPEKLSVDEINKLGQDYETIKKIDAKLTMDDREDIALGKMRQYSGNLIPVVYGDLHDFKDNIEKMNKTDPDHKIGLLKFSPHLNALK